ncbi:acyl-CoA dehydrogenase [Streptomyces oceani]|uniref:acyl-CoA dehydrogenase n=1 Tax=Streptomyces oceani TaxID=1075402 RepID=UPI0009A11247|nr:acyl-CoA dehydrogenase [Streptomyces oceani]
MSGARHAPARSRADLVEALLGDPTAPGNPAGHPALLAADRAGVVPAEAEALLDQAGMGAEFVPRELGGRFDSPEALVRVLRPVFRRDAALGMGYGLSSFLAASGVWLSGSAEQRSWLGRLLLDGSRVSVAHHETAHTNDVLRGSLSVGRGVGDLFVTGNKPVVDNLRRADGLVLFCRTGERQDDAAQSALLLDPRRLPADRYRVTAPSTVGPSGPRAYFHAGARFDACPAPPGALLGPPGGGMATALRSWHISRALTASLAVPTVDASLHATVLAGGTHRAGDVGTTRPEQRYVASTLAGAFVDLLVYDSLALVATRALQLAPTEAGIHSAAVKSLLPRILPRTMYDMATILGAGFHAVDGTAVVFRKRLGDLSLLSLGHADTAACQATIIPQLKRLARDSWFTRDEAPAELFVPGARMPPFHFGELAVASGGESLSATLLAVAVALPGRGPVPRTLRTLTDRMIVELSALRDGVLGLPSSVPGEPVGARWFALAERYALVLAAAAVLGVWRQQHGGDDAFLADPAWPTAALHRIGRLLGVGDVELPRECSSRVHQEVLARFADGRHYDLYGARLTGHPR